MVKWQYKFLFPCFIALLAIVIFPTISLFYLSFHRWVLFEETRPFVGVENFAHLFTSPSFINSAQVTTIFVIASVVLSFLFGFILALILSEKIKRGRGILRSLIALPIVVPPVVAGFSWKFLLNRDVGVLGAWLLPSIGFTKSILSTPNLALVAVILADVWTQTSLMFLILLAGLQAIPEYLYEAAKIDGANYWQNFRHVTLPLIKPTAAIALIIRFIYAFNVFAPLYVMTRGGPGTATETFPLLGWKIGFQYFKLGQAAALGVIMLLVTIVVALFFIRKIGEVT